MHSGIYRTPSRSGVSNWEDRKDKAGDSEGQTRILRYAQDVKKIKNVNGKAKGRVNPALSCS